MPTVCGPFHEFVLLLDTLPLACLLLSFRAFSALNRR